MAVVVSRAPSPALRASEVAFAADGRSSVRKRSWPALLHPAVWLGVVASLVLAAGEIRRTGVWGGTWQGSVSSRVLPHLEPRIVVLWGVVGMAVAWAWWRPRAGTRLSTVLLVGGLWMAPLLGLSPLLSTDAVSYADLGWTMLQGASPYQVGLGTSGSPFEVSRVWQGSTSVYPPGALLAFAAVVAVTGADSTGSVTGMRVLALVGLALLVVGLVVLARRVSVRATTAVWIGAFNPLVLVHGVGGAHVDLLMVGLMVAALALATRRGGWWAAAIVVGLAASVKQPGLLGLMAIPFLAPEFSVRSWRTFGLWTRALGAAAVAVGTFAAVSGASGLGWGWIGASGSPDTVPTANLVTVVSGGWPAHAQLIGQMTPLIAAVVAVAAAVLWARTRPLLAVLVVGLAWVAGFGAFREWYLLLVVPLAVVALAQATAWVRLALGAVLSVAMVQACVYGVFREYGRLPIATAFTNSALIALAVVAVMSAALRRPPLVAGRSERDAP